jgi:cysteine-rich repeat protein
MRSFSLAAALLMAVAAEAVPPPIPGVATTVLSGSAADLPIPDFGNGAPGTVLDVILAPVSGVVVDVDVALEAEHPSSGELSFYLVSPHGTVVGLSTRNGQGFDDVFADTLFDDQATGTPSAPNARNFPFADGAATGPVQPEGALGALLGEPALGPWALVVLDEVGGTTGRLRRWSLVLSTLGAFTPSTPQSFTGAGVTIPNNDPTGVTSTVAVSNLTGRLHHVAVAVAVRHTNATDLDLFLTSPEGRRIDLVTDVGGGNDDLYAGTTFDDRAPLPVSDTPLPPSGTAFAAVIPEGALSAFLGESPNGTWTLTVADDSGGASGSLDGWTLTLTTATACGDGALDAGEVCDDHNVVDGDGCDSNCTPTACGNGVVSAGESCDDGNRVGGDACPAGCRFGEVDCADCVDDDGNGLVDSADPACAPAPLELRDGHVTTIASQTKLRLVGKLPLTGAARGATGVVLGDQRGTLACVPLGELRRVRPLTARLGNGRITLKLLRNGTFKLTGRALDLGPLDGTHLFLGVRVGTQHFTDRSETLSRSGTDRESSAH